jgi:hypothetical protein
MQRMFWQIGRGRFGGAPMVVGVALANTDAVTPPTRSQNHVAYKSNDSALLASSDASRQRTVQLTPE